MNDFPQASETKIFVHHRAELDQYVLLPDLLNRKGTAILRPVPSMPSLPSVMPSIISVLRRQVFIQKRCILLRSSVNENENYFYASHGTEHSATYMIAYMSVSPSCLRPARYLPTVAKYIGHEKPLHSQEHIAKYESK